MKTSDYPLVIIGAGATGLGASEQARELGIEHLVLEASHRTGGRGLTEYLDGGIPVDLGCHWLHCASQNPYVGWADCLGFEYETGTGFDKSGSYRYRMHYHGDWLDDNVQAEYEAYLQGAYAAIRTAYNESPDTPVFDAIDGNSPWTSHFCYWMSLMHSNDIDEVSLRDVIEFQRGMKDQEELDAQAAIREAGGEIVELTAAERQQFIDAVEPVYAEMRDLYSPRLQRLVGI